MPTIKRFSGCRIEMYFGDHPPPHFHVTSRHGTVKIAIRGQRMMAGSLPQRMIREALQ
ncbi:MAG TPA: DUF4160 domain-containing protein [Stellaceae bacterium]|nr:DUF4160 domain-containing protein [Stellaceae bacterium]